MINKWPSSYDRRFTFVGTINYISPEVINEEDQTSAVDTWALGSILFKMFTGYVPFKGTNEMSVFRDIKDRKIAWPSEEEMQKIFT